MPVMQDAPEMEGAGLYAQRLMGLPALQVQTPGRISKNLPLAETQKEKAVKKCFDMFQRISKDCFPYPIIV